MNWISEGSQLSIGLSFEVIVCYKCSVPFAVPAKMRAELLRTQEVFYCPSGHQQHYTGQTNEDRLRKLLEQKERELANKTSEKVQLENELIKTQRKLKRVHNGTCPCCKRSFKDLAAHMKTKHPELVNKSK